MIDNRSWVKRAGEVARAYHDNRAELGRRKRYDRKTAYIDAPKSRGIAKPVEQIVAEIAAVDSALAAISSDKAALSVAALLYAKRGHPSVAGCARALLMPPERAHKYNKVFLRLIAKQLDNKGV